MLDTTELQGYRSVQRLAYECTETVGTALEVGTTEKDAVAAMWAWLSARGVAEWFHIPFAWFGDRTSFEHFRSRRAFAPSDRALMPDMPVILDVAPVVDRYQADVGYAMAFGSVPLMERMMDDLAVYRVAILDAVKAEKSLYEIYRMTDEIIADQGYRNRHYAYPNHTLAHRVGRIGGFAETRRIEGFGVPSVRFLAGELLASARGAKEHFPFMSPSRSGRRPAAAGLWAVEPHLGLHGVGAKWEELLVVTDSDAFWLDDDLPHVRRWINRGVVPASTISTSGTPV